ncbi:alpha/beta-hydrolase [Thozetella sp. PMI_491]|nr:alpha/beta-hydrolase [Thozetella sp. PMI_491]
MEGQSISFDSISFFVKHEGDKTKPLVVLSHALMANHHMWDDTVPVLHAAGFSTLRYDHVGHNKTDFETRDAAEKLYHFDDFTRHIHTLVEKVTPGRRPFGIIGCSMGGVLALRYAQMYPGVLTKVMSCDAPGMKSLDFAKPLWKSRMAQFESDGVESLAQATVARWFPEPCPAATRQQMLEQVRTCKLTGYNACANGIMSYDYEPGLEEIQQEEVMVFAGENDSAIGPVEILAHVAKKIPGSKYILMKDVGHLPPFHDPRGFNKIMLEFFQS